VQAVLSLKTSKVTAANIAGDESAAPVSTMMRIVVSTLAVTPQLGIAQTRRLHARGLTYE